MNEGKNERRKEGKKEKKERVKAMWRIMVESDKQGMEETASLRIALYSHGQLFQRSAVC